MPVRRTLGRWPAPGTAAYIGWGLKTSGLRAQSLAAKHNRACWLLEDGFLRSLESSNSISYSLVIDDEGIYYDARRPSALERLIRKPLDVVQKQRTTALINAWREAGVSKYNGARDPDLIGLPKKYVLVVDQTAGDASIAGGMATEASFQSMLEDALAHNPDCAVLLKVHPEVAAGHKNGHFDIETLKKIARIQIIAEDVHPALILKYSEAVYTVTSQLGFEALLWGKPVYAYGMPFYAGWDLTVDQLATPARRNAASLEQVVHAALIEYPRYFDPESDEQCEVETLLAWLALQRKERHRFPKKLVAYGFSKWKRQYVNEFLAGSEVTFTNTVTDCPSGSLTVTWGHKHTHEFRSLPHPISLVRIEDGFIRSVGLGAEFVRPISWVIDSDGIYYDANKPSGLEHILSDAHFTEALCKRAADLREKLVSLGITKYNLSGLANWQREENSGYVILVPGQVESDAAITYGTTHITRNIDLLRAVRAKHPDAWIIYKPHPDVVAGLRDRGVTEHEARNWCDEIVNDVPYHTLLESVDEVHVMSSLAGFEALLRGLPVSTWGQPFYAGWGLTRDYGLTTQTRSRRRRALTLDQLVAGVLILYPTYVSRITRKFCSPERAVDELRQWRHQARSNPARRLIARLLRKP
ncbi:capsular polysaccharide biosynthesis protein [Bordetella petrii]|uniref:capsular polysaccharide biosynthesis protein n=1 Tax=Bordetella petrii TaxID=94624 RepID=UPI001E47E69C|nr:capsular polysaccharide biosynthesis protein [Bordetella petrii]MCD0501730.1 capsular polysaccharide biosynthesis protein [Bordetella petrii]